MTRDEALAKIDTGWWKNSTAWEIVAFQLYEERLCMPFGDFHKATEEALGRPVWTHEFAFVDSLRAEFEGRAAKASMQDVLDKIPPGKRVVVIGGGE